MKMFNKTKLNIALSSAFVGMALVGLTQTASAVYPDSANSSSIDTGTAATTALTKACSTTPAAGGAATAAEYVAVLATGGVPAAADGGCAGGNDTPILKDAGYDATALPYVSKNNLGQALIYPYYTVRNGMRTLVNVINTSNVAVAVKVRFREAHNSRDVLDFNLVLSPKDKWSGYVVDDPTNGPVLKTSDLSCTIPAITSTGAAFNSESYLGGSSEDAGEQTIDRMREGYVEIIAMGYATAGDSGLTGGPRVGATGGALSVLSALGNTAAASNIHPGKKVALSTTTNVGNTAYNATHVAGVPRDCGAVVSKFIPGVSFSSGAGYPGNGEPPAALEFAGLPAGFNPLRGTLVYINKDGGVGAGISAVAIADFHNEKAVTHSAALAAPSNTYDKVAAGSGTANGSENLITAQEGPYFLEPTLASRDGLWTTSGLLGLEPALMVENISNEWADNSANGAAVDWSVTFPTKSFHVDIPQVSLGGISSDVATNIQAGVNQNRLTVTGAVPISGVVGTANQPMNIVQKAPFAKIFGATGSAIKIVPKLYDNEETSTVGGVSFSPGTFGTAAIPYEANIITTGATSVLSTANPQQLTPATNISGNPTSGWIGMEIADGLPTVGFAFKERDSGNAALSFGQVMSHSYSKQD